MKKVIITSLVLALAICVGKAQSHESRVEINKSFQNAVCIELPYTVSDIETTLAKRFASSGKGKSSKGFVEYSGVKFAEFTLETISIYTKVEKSKLNRNGSKVYILVAMLDGQFCSSATCERLIDNVKKFLDDLAPHVELHTAGILLEKNTSDLKKAEQELQKLQSDAISLEKDRDKILKRIDDNTQKIQNKQKEVEMKRQIVNETHIQKLQIEANLPK